jgi:hypothetical protein
VVEFASMPADARRRGVAHTIFSPRKAMDILGTPSALGRRSFNE